VSMHCVWLNGSFGAGKTTLAERLVELHPELLLFDAELPGFMLRQVVPTPTGDFQDLRAWRRSVSDTAVTLLEEYGRDLVVPMTVVVPVYLEEIFSTLRSLGVRVTHFFLAVPPTVLRDRIEAQSIWPDDLVRDAEVRTWRLAQVQRCAAAVDSLPADTVILDGEAPTEKLVERIMTEIAAGAVT
jgi:hypothetical protein